MIRVGEGQSRMGTFIKLLVASKTAFYLCRYESKHRHSATTRHPDARATRLGLTYP